HNSIAAHALSCILNRNILGQIVDGRFGNAVRHSGQIRIFTTDRRDVDDRAAAGFDHRLNGLFTWDINALEVVFYNAEETVGVAVDQVKVNLHIGSTIVIDQDVDSAF